MKDPLSNLTIYLAGDFGAGLPHSKLKTFITHNGGTNADKVSNATTHIVCSPSLSSTGASDLVNSIKHHAIVKKCKMVTYDWLEDSLQSKKKLPESKYLFDMKLRQREAKIEEGRLKLVARHQEKERVMAVKAKMKKDEERKRREVKVVRRRAGVLWGWVVSGEGEEKAVKRGRGRPKKVVDVEEDGEMHGGSGEQGQMQEKEVVKRGRGRPKKVVEIEEDNEMELEEQQQEQGVVKRGRGRPRKTVTVVQEIVKGKLRKN